DSRDTPVREGVAVVGEFPDRFEGRLVGVYLGMGEARLAVAALHGVERDGEVHAPLCRGAARARVHGADPNAPDVAPDLDRPLRREDAVVLVLKVGGAPAPPAPPGSR